jgi:hypothetical protein
MLGEFLFGIVLCAHAHWPTVCTEAKAKHMQTEVVHEMECSNRLKEFDELWHATPKMKGRVWAFCRPLHTERT